ncbi:MAG: periplasmic heavy metal sensor [Rhodobacteraceae bacterium]|nr:periplasmic heavy metal sensor [Paracoccaceae bacterium]
MMVRNEVKPRSKWVKPVLIASLAINLVVLGLVVGAAFGGHHRPGPGIKAPQGVRSYISAMTPEQREVFDQRSLHSLSGSIKTLRKLRTGHKDVMAAIVTAPFSEDNLRAAMDRQRGDVSAIMGEFQEELIVTLVAMSDEERMQYVERMKEMRKKRWRKKRD